ncbi:hypothetical protein EV44_g3253 [Erysiphe necator]|uniref:Uncharacterized protein n=1 Tax=Uncinula necator TaxID=52586 RepID=A0A0B1NX70_UNCNE|nr:hypothetical protein EV44_g3253 [Erysiphe necator]
MPLLKAAEAIRSCGISEFRWDSNDQEDVHTFQGEARRICRSYPESILRALVSYRPEVMSSTSWSYESAPITMEQVKDPEKANAAKRVAEITRKYRARAREYEQRIQFLKTDQGGIRRGRLVKHKEKKIVYLTAARTIMSCAHFDKGPTLNHEITAQRLLERINEKIRSKGDTPRVTEHLTLIVNGEINEKRLREANGRGSVFGWHPDEYARGIDAALSWVIDDCAHESRLVYYVPRYIQVKTKVRTHRLQQDVATSDFHRRVHLAAEGSHATNLDAVDLAPSFATKSAAPIPGIRAVSEVVEDSQGSKIKKLLST